MKEIRAIVNAVFLFGLFLLAYALVTPGHASRAERRPRFLRMEVENPSAGGPERLSFSIPFGLVSGGLRFASTGRIRRQLEENLSQDVEADELKGIWDELSSHPDGTVVTRKHDECICHFRKEGSIVAVDIGEDGVPGGERVSLRLPAHLVESLVTGGRSFDADTLISQLRSASRGDLVDVRSKDAHVRIWVE